MYQIIKVWNYFLVSSFSTQQPIKRLPCFYGPGHAIASASYHASRPRSPAPDDHDQINRNRYLSPPPPDRRPIDETTTLPCVPVPPFAILRIEIARNSLVEPREQRARFVAVRPSIGAARATIATSPFTRPVCILLA